MGVALRDSSPSVFDKLGQDVQNPSFIKDISTPYGIELLQGKNFVKTGSYNDYEQLLCSIEGMV